MFDTAPFIPKQLDHALVRVCGETHTPSSLGEFSSEEGVEEKVNSFSRENVRDLFYRVDREGVKTQLI